MLEQIIKETQLNLKHKTFIIPNVVNTSQFNILSCKLKTINKINILWVGHFEPVKRLPVLLGAFKIFLKNYSSDISIQLNLVGDGLQKNEIEQLADNFGIRKFLNFHGQADRDKLNYHYNNSDFLVVSSEVETFSVVTIEAMSCGLPVLSTKCGGPESIINNDLGLLVDKSELALAEGFQYMINNLSRFDKVKIRNYILENFSGEIVSKKIKMEYLKLIRKNPIKNEKY